MAKLRYEPAAVAASLAVLFQAAMLFGWLPDAFDSNRVSESLVLIATALAGFYVRSRAYPAAKIEDAASVDPSLHPEAIEDKARVGRHRKRAARGGPSV